MPHHLIRYDIIILSINIQDRLPIMKDTNPNNNFLTELSISVTAEFSLDKDCNLWKQGEAGCRSAVDGFEEVPLRQPASLLS